MKTLGKSELKIAPLALGGNVFGWTADEETSFRILDHFVDAGGTMIDTADVYSAWVPGHSGGESETVIGKWLKRDPSKRDKVVIATKVGMMAGLAPDTVAKACEDSLTRLGVETIDLYYQHKDDENVPLAESLGAFQKLVDAGKVRETGLSNFTADRLSEAVKCCEKNGFRKPAAIQNWYNLVERDKFEGKLRDVALDHGIWQFPYYSLANGFLTGKYRSEADLQKSVRGLRNMDYVKGEHGQRILAAMDELSEELGVSLATIALAWSKRQPGIGAPIASATSVEQLEALIAAMDLKLTNLQLEKLGKASGTMSDGD